MLWLHGQFLDVELPSDLKNQELSELSVKQLADVAKQLAKILDKNFQKLKEPQVELDEFFQESPQAQLDRLKELSNKSLLKKLVNETASKLLSHRDGEIEYSSYIKEKLLMYFKDFEKLDTVLYPLDYLAGTPEKQIIETFRISPEDAKLGLSSKFQDGNRLDKKLAGDSLKAFGDFFKKSWRANDILWGRLDGLNRIVDALVTEEKIKNFPKFVEAQRKIEGMSQDQYLDSLLEEALFLPDRDRKPEDKEYLEDKISELKKKLKGLFPVLSKHSNDEQSLKYKENFKELLEYFKSSLVYVGHLIILDKQLNETMKASIEEQLVGKQQRKPSEKSETSKNETKAPNQEFNMTLQSSGEEQSDGQQQKQLTKNYEELPPIPTFAPIDCSFDSAITALVVKRVAEESLSSMSLEEKEDFFNENYKIGSETWKHIPKSELQDLILKCILIFQDIFKTWQSRTEAQIISNSSNSSNSNRLNFWNRIGLKFLGWMVNIAIWVIKNILVRRF